MQGNDKQSWRNLSSWNPHGGVCIQYARCRRNSATGGDDASRQRHCIANLCRKHGCKTLSQLRLEERGDPASLAPQLPGPTLSFGPKAAVKHSRQKRLRQLVRSTRWARRCSQFVSNMILPRPVVMTEVAWLSLRPVNAPSTYWRTTICAKL